MPTFMEFLKSKTPGKDDIHTFDPKREEELKSQLRTINDHLKQKVSSLKLQSLGQRTWLNLVCCVQP